MKALTIRQPWAWAICAGFKTVENRTWLTNYRGELAIHAGTSREDVAAGLAFLKSLGILCVPEERDLRCGAIIGVVDLVDCVRVPTPAGQKLLFPDSCIDQSPFATGPWCWLLDSASPERRRLYSEPTVCRGLPGLFDVFQ